MASAEHPGDRLDHGVVDPAATLLPSGARTSFRPPRLRMEIGTRMVTVRPSLVRLGSVITAPSEIPV